MLICNYIELEVLRIYIILVVNHYKHCKSLEINRLLFDIFYWMWHLIIES